MRRAGDTLSTPLCIRYYGRSNLYSLRISGTGIFNLGNRSTTYMRDWFRYVQCPPSFLPFPTSSIRIRRRISVKRCRTSEGQSGRGHTSSASVRCQVRRTIRRYHPIPFSICRHCALCSCIPLPCSISRSRNVKVFTQT